MLFVCCVIGLSACGINCNYLYGRRYDSAMNMVGQFKGVQSTIKAKFSKALYVHYTAHSLNLAVLTVSDMKTVQIV